MPRLLAASLFAIVASCAINAERAYNASAQRVIAEAIIERAEDVQEQQVEPSPKLDEIVKLAQSAKLRAEIQEVDHGKPDTEPVIGSDIDNKRVVTYAGQAATQKHVRELPARIAEAVIVGSAAIVKRVVPTWLWWCIAGLAALVVACLATSIVVWFNRRFWRTSTAEAIERFGRLPVEDRKRLTASAHTLGRAYERMQGNGQRS